MNYTIANGKPLRSLRFDRNGRDSETILAGNELGRSVAIHSSASPEWLVLDSPASQTVPPGETARIELRVSWASVPEGSGTASGRLTLAEDGGPRREVDILLLTERRQISPLTILGGGRIDLGTRTMMTGPGTRNEHNSLGHVVTVIAENGAFRGAVRSRAGWLDFTIDGPRSLADKGGLQLALDETADIHITVCWKSLAPGRVRNGAVEIVSLPQGNIVGKVEFSIRTRETRRPREFAMPSQVDFGLVPGSILATRSLTLNNDGGDPITARLVEEPEWLDVEMEPGVELGPGSRRRILVHTRPPVAGKMSGRITLAIYYGAQRGRTIEIPVTGHFSRSQ